MTAQLSLLPTAAQSQAFFLCPTLSLSSFSTYKPKPFCMMVEQQPLHCQCHFKSNILLSYYKNLLRDYFTIRFFLRCYVLMFFCSSHLLSFFSLSFLNRQFYINISNTQHIVDTLLLRFLFWTTSRLSCFYVPYLFINFITTRIIIARSFLFDLCIFLYFHFLLVLFNSLHKILCMSRTQFAFQNT